MQHLRVRLTDWALRSLRFAAPRQLKVSVSDLPLAGHKAAHWLIDLASLKTHGGQAMVSQLVPQSEHCHSLTTPAGEQVELTGAVMRCPQVQVLVPCDGDCRGSSRTILEPQRRSNLRSKSNGYTMPMCSLPFWGGGSAVTSLSHRCHFMINDTEDIGPKVSDS